MRLAKVLIMIVLLIIAGCNGRYDVNNMRNQSFEVEIGNGDIDVLLIIAIDGIRLKALADKQWGLLRPGGPLLVQLNTGDSRANLVVDEYRQVALPLYTGINSIMLKNVSAEVKCKVVLTGDRECATSTVEVCKLPLLNASVNCKVYSWSVP